MKKIVTSLLFMLILAFSLQAQDIIIKKNGDEIQSKILEITPTEITYKRFDYQDGPTISVYSKDVFMIKFSNGTKQVITPPAKSSTSATVPEQPALPKAPAPISFDGPRIGVTFIAPGSAADRLSDAGISPVVSQFGWQFETRLFTTADQFSGLVEWVPLIGGLEQGAFLPSFSGILGVRGKTGFEFGVGPNLSLAGAALVFATGFTAQTDYVNIPFNFAFVPSTKGARFSVTTGFNLRKR